MELRIRKLLFLPIVVGSECSYRGFEVLTSLHYVITIESSFGWILGEVLLVVGVVASSRILVLSSGCLFFPSLRLKLLKCDYGSRVSG